jgi:flagellar motor switch protein FliN
MHIPLTQEAVTRAFAREWSRALSATIGAAATLTPSQISGEPGWAVTVPLSGAVSGRMVIWTDGPSATAAAKRALSLDTEPSDDAIAGILGETAGRAAEAVVTAPEGAGLTAGEPSSRKAAAPPEAEPFTASFDDGLACHFEILVEFGASPKNLVESNDDTRLEAVLEVDLPLIVRFGRAVMPLRAIADLSPGSVVDMGRSPDEPVELLVGERLIARGEVVIVGGNYGVRITELTNGRRATDLETRS